MEVIVGQVCPGGLNPLFSPCGRGGEEGRGKEPELMSRKANQNTRNKYVAI